jgi:ribonuclease HI
VLYTDGASRGNPGPAAIGGLIKGDDGVVKRISRYIGVGTNNQAEYRALIAALEAAAELGADRVDIRLDSELVVKQIKGQYRVKNIMLIPLFHRAKELLRGFNSFSIAFIPRWQNREADRLAQAAFKAAD